jgi:hypothetical protein
MKTAEEKKQERERRLAEKRQMSRLFPHCHISCVHRTGEVLQLILDEGDEWGSLRIRTNAPLTVLFQPSHVGGDAGWVEAYFSFHGIEEMSRLISCLTSRLRPRISSVNDYIENINSISVLPLARTEKRAANPATQEERQPKENPKP